MALALPPGGTGLPGETFVPISAAPLAAAVDLATLPELSPSSSVGELTHAQQAWEGMIGVEHTLQQQVVGAEERLAEFDAGSAASATGSFLAHAPPELMAAFLVLAILIGLMIASYADELAARWRDKFVVRDEGGDVELGERQQRLLEAAFPRSDATDLAALGLSEQAMLLHERLEQQQKPPASGPDLSSLAHYPACKGAKKSMATQAVSQSAKLPSGFTLAAPPKAKTAKLADKPPSTAQSKPPAGRGGPPATKPPPSTQPPPPQSPPPQPPPPQPPNAGSTKPQSSQPPANRSQPPPPPQPQPQPQPPPQPPQQRPSSAAPKPGVAVRTASAAASLAVAPFAAPTGSGQTAEADASTPVVPACARSSSAAVPGPLKAVLAVKRAGEVSAAKPGAPPADLPAGKVLPNKPPPARGRQQQAQAQQQAASGKPSGTRGAATRPKAGTTPSADSKQQSGGQSPPQASESSAVVAGAVVAPPETAPIKSPLKLGAAATVHATGGVASGDDFLAKLAALEGKKAKKVRKRGAKVAAGEGITDVAVPLLPARAPSGNLSAIADLEWQQTCAHQGHLRATPQPCPLLVLCRASLRIPSHRTAPHRTASHRIAPHRTASHRIAPTHSRAPPRALSTSPSPPLLLHLSFSASSSPPLLLRLSFSRCSQSEPCALRMQLGMGSAAQPAGRCHLWCWRAG